MFHLFKHFVDADGQPVPFEQVCLALTIIRNQHSDFAERVTIAALRRENKKTRLLFELTDGRRVLELPIRDPYMHNSCPANLIGAFLTLVSGRNIVHEIQPTATWETDRIVTHYFFVHDDATSS